MVVLGIVGGPATGEAKDAALLQGLEWALDDLATGDQIFVSGQPTHFLLRRVDSDGSIAGTRRAVTALVTDETVDFIVGAISLEPGTKGEVLDDNAMSRWQSDLSKGSNPAIMLNVEDGRVSGGQALEMALSGKSRQARIWRDFRYDGTSKVQVDIQLQVVEHTFPGGAFLYIRGYDSGGAETLRIIYPWYENFDVATSAPTDLHEFHTLKFKAREPELGTWQSFSADVTADFDEEFPGIWEALGITTLRLELSTWTDSMMTARFANPVLRLGNQVTTLVGIQQVTEPSGVLLFADYRSPPLLSGNRTFIIRPSDAEIALALYRALAKKRPEVQGIAVLRNDLSEAAELSLVMEMVDKEFPPETFKLVATVQYSGGTNDLAEAIDLVLEARPQVIDLGAIPLEDQITAIVMARDAGFIGPLLSYNPDIFKTLVELGGRMESISSGLFFPGVPWTNPDLPQPLKVLKERYVKRFGDNPDLYVIFAHELILPPLVKALESAGVLEPLLLIAALRSLQWETVFGPALFIDNGTGVASQVSLPIPVSQFSSNGVEYLGPY